MLKKVKSAKVQLEVERLEKAAKANEEREKRESENKETGKAGTHRWKVNTDGPTKAAIEDETQEVQITNVRLGGGPMAATAGLSEDQKQ